MNLTERMWEISRLDREIEALKRPARTVLPLQKPVPNPELNRLQVERHNHVKVIQNS